MGDCFVYREYAKPNMVISDGAKEVCDITANEKIYATLAPPDLWSRSQESGLQRADIFRKSGLPLIKSKNDRVTGWACVRELLRCNPTPKLRIFSNCTGLIKCLTSIRHDDTNPNDCDTMPHNITHLPDALRYFAIKHTKPATIRTEHKPNMFTGDDITKFLRRN